MNVETKGIRCQIYNVGGDIIYDDIFVVYSGEPPRTAADLKITPRGGDEYIRLENDTILIAQKHEAQLRDGLDWLFGKKATRVE
jgi:hypothetical protein